MGFAHRTLSQRFTIGIVNFLIMVPLTFVIEEVPFRGAFDSHVHRPGEPQGFRYGTVPSATDVRPREIIGSTSFGDRHHLRTSGRVNKVEPQD